MQSLPIYLLLLAAANSTFAESCWSSASERYGIHDTLLRAIALTESAMDSTAINYNTNGSVDVGLMQINSRWFPQLAEMGLQPGDLWNPCTNIHVGAWILAGEIRRFGYTRQAVGAYHAGPALTVAREQRRRKYAKRAYQNLAAIRRADVDGLRLDDR